jgi:peptidoglycan-associated lipoprotein
MKAPVRSVLLATAVTVTLAGCADYVKRNEYDAAIAELRQNQAGLRSDLDATRTELANLKSEMDTKFQQYGAQISELQGRLRVDVPAHFAFNRADLQDSDKALLNDFAKVIREHHPNVLVTVEGFTDSAGSTAYNQRLGLRRADAVKDYLVQQGGMSADSIRAVSYGESRNRQVVPGATHDQGAPNRRVALVIDEVAAPADDSGTTGSSEAAPATTGSATSGS